MPHIEEIVVEQVGSIVEKAGGLDTFSQYGIAGLILFVLFMIVRMFIKDREKADDRWRSAFDVHSTRYDKRASETNEVLRELTGVIKDVNHNSSNGM